MSTVAEEISPFVACFYAAYAGVDSIQQDDLLEMPTEPLVHPFVITSASLSMKTPLKALLLLTAAVCLLSQGRADERADWNRPAKPFRIIGNIYYVGASGVSAFLITTSSGSILLDAGLPETAPLIERNIAALGFQVNNIKYLLNSHAHYDHCGGLAEIKRLSGAQMISSEADKQTLIRGHQLSYGPGQHDAGFPPVKVDRTVSDGEQISLGGAVLTAHLTPGHTKGCTTWSMPVVSKNKSYQVVFYCSTTVAGNQLVNNRKYPDIVSDYERSFAKLRSLPCDVFLGPHPGFFHRDEKLHRLESGRADAFIDSRELRRFVDDSEMSFREELKWKQINNQQLK